MIKGYKFYSHASNNNLFRTRNFEKPRIRIKPFTWIDNRVRVIREVDPQAKLAIVG